MAKFKREVEILIQARDQASKVADQTASKLRRAFDRLNKPIGGSGENAQFGGALVKNAARAVAAMGTVEVAIGSVNAASAAVRGEWQETSELIKQLPAGIGPVARQLEMLIGNVTGLNDRIREMDERQARITKQGIEQNRRIAAEVALRERVREKIRQIAREALVVRTQLEGGTEAEAKAFLEVLDRRGEIRKLSEQLREGSPEGGIDDRLANELEEAVRLAKELEDELARRRRNEQQYVEEQHRQAQASLDFDKAMADEAERKAEAIREQSERMAAAIRNEARVQAEANADFDAAIASGRARRGSTPLINRFLTGAPGSAADPQQKIAKQGEKSIKQRQEQNQLLRMLLNAQTEGKIIVTRF